MSKPPIKTHLYFLHNTKEFRMASRGQRKPIRDAANKRARHINKQALQQARTSNEPVQDIDVPLIKHTSQYIGPC